MHTVKVFNESGKAIPTYIEIDGKPMPCRLIDYHADIDTVPIFIFEVTALSDIEVNYADICFKYHPETVVEAVKILRHELMQYGDVYNGFARSIESALKEAKPYTKEIDLARSILDRITGC